MLVVPFALLVVSVFAALRYLPLIDEVRAVRVSASRVAAQARALGPADLERGSVGELRAGLAELDLRLVPLRDVVVADPIVRLARGLPVVGTQVAAADHLVAAADSLIEAGDMSLDLADELVTLREADAANPSMPFLPGVLELMAASTQRVDRIGELVEEAVAQLDSIPDGALGQIREARDLVREPLRDYGPLLARYREVDDVLPGMLGLGGERRYLVLAQNPAELRPTGGYSGTIGVVTLRDGAIVEQHFRDVHELDRLEGLPFIEPPVELVDHLLGEEQSWRLADANWSPHFPTSAQQALEFYELQADDPGIDGVFAINTFALDRLLEVVGPVTVDEHGVTVEPGNVTLVLLDATRGGPREGRKEVLDALAGEVMTRLRHTEPERWPQVLDAITEIIDRRMALAWFVDEEVQALAVESGLAGLVRQDGTDYVYVVEANMAPTSKFNLVIDRSSSLVVRLDEVGDALSSIRLDWENDAGMPGEPYRSLREFSFNQDGLYGAYVRLLVPAESDLITVNGMASDVIRAVGRVSQEAGRAAFGNSLLIPPGPATLTYLWSTPGAAVRTADGWEYRLVVQKQPGARPEPLNVRIDLPEGTSVTDATEGVIIEDDRLRLETTMVEDVEILVRYGPTEGVG